MSEAFSSSDPIDAQDNGLQQRVTDLEEKVDSLLENEGKQDGDIELVKSLASAGNDDAPDLDGDTREELDILQRKMSDVWPLKESDDATPPQCITAKILAQDATDKSKFSWQEEYRHTDGTWAAPTGGQTGTLTGDPAYQLDSGSTTDLSGMHVVLVHGNIVKPDTSIITGWLIVGTGVGGLTRVVPVAVDGGASGGDTTQCSFTYTFTVDGTVYAHVGMTGNGRRDPIGTMFSGSVGHIFFDAGTWKLAYVDEQNDVDICVNEETNAFGF